MDPRTTFCRNWHCPARGQIGRGNIGIHSQKEQRFICHACHKTFSARKGTVFYRLRTSAETVVLVVTPLRAGNPSRAGCPSPATRSVRALRRGPAACQLPTGRRQPLARWRGRGWAPWRGEPKAFQGGACARGGRRERAGRHERGHRGRATRWHGGCARGRCKRSDTVGELRSAEIFASHMRSLMAKEPRKAYSRNPCLRASK